MIVKFYQHDKYGSGYLGSKEMSVIPREGDRVRYDVKEGLSWCVHRIYWEIDNDSVEILLTRL